MRCQACGAENRSGKKFCAQCGTRLTSACPSCGSAVEPGSKFCGDCGAPLGGAVGSEAVETSPVSTTAPTDATAERRQLTVMFVDLVGSTELSTRLDPEDLREVLATYHAFIAEVVNEHGGYVAQFLGDGALVYFGYPTSHEDDAERSVRTALALLARTSGLTIRGNDIRIRIGIARGLVVVGDKALGSDAAHEPRIMGETSNLAARLQSMANPNAIVMAESNLFDLEDLGPKDIKGKLDAVLAQTSTSKENVGCFGLCSCNPRCPATKNRFRATAGTKPCSERSRTFPLFRAGVLPRENGSVDPA